jgi:hypothetical protein
MMVFKGGRRWKELHQKQLYVAVITEPAVIKVGFVALTDLGTVFAN